LCTRTLGSSRRRRSSWRPPRRSPLTRLTSSAIPAHAAREWGIPHDQLSGWEYQSARLCRAERWAPNQVLHERIEGPDRANRRLQDRARPLQVVVAIARASWPGRASAGVGRSGASSRSGPSQARRSLIPSTTVSDSHGSLCWRSAALGGGDLHAGYVGPGDSQCVPNRPEHSASGVGLAARRASPRRGPQGAWRVAVEQESHALELAPDIGSQRRVEAGLAGAFDQPDPKRGSPQGLVYPRDATRSQPQWACVRTWPIACLGTRVRDLETPRPSSHDRRRAADSRVW